MFSSFTGKFFAKQKRKKFIIRVSIISASVLLVLFISLRVASVIVLKKIAVETFNRFGAIQPASSTSYDISYSFTKSKITIKNVKITIKTGDTFIDKIEMKKISGLVVPSKIEITLDGVKSGDGFKMYNFKLKEGDGKIIVRLNKYLFKKPKYGGLQIEKPTKISIIEEGNEIGMLQSDFIDIIDNTNYNGEGTMMHKAKGSVIFHKIPFIKFLSLAGQPFSWDIDLRQKTLLKKWGINNSQTTKYIESQINRFIIDHSFAKVSVNGNLSMSNQLDTIEAQVIIENYSKLVKEAFNLMMAVRPEKNDMHTSIYKKLSNQILPYLKAQNPKSTRNDLFVDLHKTAEMSSLEVNGVDINKIAAKFATK